MAREVRDLVAKYLRNVRPSGRNNVRAECPFHSGPSAARSLYVHVSKGSWLCFSCKASGQLVHLLTRLGLSREQVESELKELQLPALIPRSQQLKAELAREVVHLPEYVLGAYDTCPTKLLDAGFTEEILRAHDVGYDRVQDRITFPIRDYNGRLAAVSGRAYDDWVVPRYRVYEREFQEVAPGYVADNSAHLYGFSTVYAERFLTDLGQALPPLLVVEGYKGCLWLRQLGFQHTVALQGSYLTDPQERLLNKMRGPYYVMLDHEPGKALPDRNRRCAALWIAKRLRRYGVAFICSYKEGSPEGTSPDDLPDADTVATMINTAQTPGQFSIHLATLPRSRQP